MRRHNLTAPFATTAWPLIYTVLGQSQLHSQVNCIFTWRKTTKILNGKSRYTSRKSNCISLAYQKRDSSVITIRRLQPEASANWDLLPGRGSIQDVSRVQILSNGNREKFPGIKRPKGEAYHSSVSGAKVKNVWKLISILPYVLLWWTGTLLPYLSMNMQMQIKTQTLSLQPTTFPSFHMDTPTCWVMLIPNNL